MLINKKLNFKKFIHIFDRDIMTSPYFELTSLTPVFLNFIYPPDKFCAVCKGSLNEQCNFCLQPKDRNPAIHHEAERIYCPIVSSKNVEAAYYYHKHCGKFL